MRLGAIDDLGAVWEHWKSSAVLLRPQRDTDGVGQVPPPSNTSALHIAGGSCQPPTG